MNVELTTLLSHSIFNRCMKKIFVFLLVVLTCGGRCFAQTVHLVYNQSSPQVSYAARILKKALSEKNIQLNNGKPSTEINLSVDAIRQTKEAYTIVNNGKRITVTGGDERGVIYGSFAIAEDIRKSVSLNKIQSTSEKPHVPFRGIKYDLPWDTYRNSTALYLHTETCKDLHYWEAFLDMMAQNRFNVLTLWNLHPYPYMIRAKNFPEACPFDDEELKQWQQLFHGILGMAKERGIETYIIPFNIFVSPSFAKAHNVSMENLAHEIYAGSGDTSEIIKRYTRESVTQLLQEYPELTGMGLTHGEYMRGMTQPQRDGWMNETIIAGMKLCGRKTKLIHRIPLSADTSHGGSTSIETERQTRKLIEQEAEQDFIEGPIWLDMKFNWSHALSTTKLIKIHGGKVYGALFEPVPEKYKVIWTARNEDIFCLRWGVPDFVREHINRNTPPYAGGYLIGSETYIPAKDYFTNPAISVPWKYAFERQWLFYELWGRLLYNPSTPDKIFQEEFIRRYGKQGTNLLAASNLAGKTPLRLASAYDFTYDLTLYSEGFMALDSNRNVVYITINQLINQKPTDPDYVSVFDFVKASVSGETFPANKITPPVLIQMLERDCSKALELVRNINTSKDNALMYEVADIKTWANLGLHYAEKLKASVALQTYRVRGGEENQQQAIEHAQNALKYWDTVIAITRPIYNDMPSVHLSQQDRKPWRENDHLRFHWAKLRPDVARDIQVIKIAVVEAQNKPTNTTQKWFEEKAWLNGLPLQPHASINQREFEKQYKANTLLWNKAFQYLKETNLEALKPGKYSIDGDNVFATVTEGPARSADTAKWEAHQQYIDIHHVISGKENMGLAPLSSATMITPYNSAKDIGFYKANGTFYESEPDNFFIAFPSDAHLPNIQIKSYDGPVKKIVIKVKKA
jgi:YhcH/YjgK/YiaL family protein